MMEFKDTSLPYEAQLYQAFAAQVKSGGERAQNHAVLTAQLINTATGGQDIELMTLAFLANIPEVAYGALSRRFHPDTMAAAKEISLHARTGFAWIEDASPQVKAYAAANAVASVMEFDAAFEEAKKVTRALRAYGSKDNSGVSVPDAPSQKLLDTVAKNKSGIEALDWLLIEKAEYFRMTADSKLSMLGRATQRGDFPAFEESSLLQDDKVKRAYETLINDPRALVKDISVAIEAGRLLGAVNGGSTAIAAALIDIGLPARGKDDLDFLQKRVDWDVMELLAQYKVGGINTKELTEAPVEFRLLAVAHAATAMHFALREGQDMLARIEKDGGNGGSFLKQTTLELLDSRYQKATLVSGVTGSIASPALEQLFERELTAMKNFLAVHKPKPLLMLPAPSKSTPGRKGGFNL